MSRHLDTFRHGLSTLCVTVCARAALMPVPAATAQRDVPAAHKPHAGVRLRPPGPDRRRARELHVAKVPPAAARARLARCGAAARRSEAHRCGRQRTAIWDSLRFDEPVEFEEGYTVRCAQALSPSRAALALLCLACHRACQGPPQRAHTHNSFIECSIEAGILLSGMAPSAPSRCPPRHWDKFNGFSSRDEFNGFPSHLIHCMNQLYGSEKMFKKMFQLSSNFFECIQYYSGDIVKKGFDCLAMFSNVFDTILEVFSPFLSDGVSIFSEFLECNCV